MTDGELVGVISERLEAVMAEIAVICIVARWACDQPRLFTPIVMDKTMTEALQRMIARGAP